MRLALDGGRRAPALEKSLHHILTRFRVNRVNLRKEYFAVDLDTIIKAARDRHGEIDYVAEPEALEYRESLTVDADDLVAVEEELAEMGLDLEEIED